MIINPIKYEKMIKIYYSSKTQTEKDGIKLFINSIKCEMQD